MLQYPLQIAIILNLLTAAAVFPLTRLIHQRVIHQSLTLSIQLQALPHQPHPTQLQMLQIQITIILSLLTVAVQFLTKPIYQRVTHQSQMVPIQHQTLQHQILPLRLIPQVPLKVTKQILQFKAIKQRFRIPLQILHRILTKLIQPLAHKILQLK